MLRGQTEDVDTIQKREDVRRDDLIDEHPRKRDPKQAYPFMVRTGIKVQS